MTKDEFVAKHFPEIDPMREPCGARITVQLMHIPRLTSGGIELAGDTREFNKNATVVARIVKVGPLAFCNRETGDAWREGKWGSVGDIVLMPRYGGVNRVEIPLPGTELKRVDFDEDDRGRQIPESRREIPIKGSEEKVVFATYNDHDLYDKILGHYDLYSNQIL